MANIYFKRVTLNNFMSYESASIDLNKKGYVLVKGINNNPDDVAKSNGSGKSSIFSAISWCLTGETITGAKNVANIYLEGTTEVEVEFSLDGHDYIIKRTKNPSNLFITVDGENKSGKGIRDTAEIIEEYLPQITHNLINSVIILGQGLPQRFTNNSPSGRKEVLEKLSNSDFMIEDIKERLSARKEYLNNSLNEASTEYATKTGIIESTSKDVKELKQELSEMDNEALLKEITDITVEIQEIAEEIEGLEVQYKEYQDLFIKSSDDYNNFISSIEDRREQVKLEEYDETEINNITVEVALLQQEYATKSSINDVCPTCGQKIPDVNKPDAATLESLNKKLQDKKDKLNELAIEKSKVESSNKEKLSNFKAENDAKAKELKEIADQNKDDFNLIDSKHIEMIHFKNTKDTRLEVLKTKLEEFNTTVELINHKITTKEKEVVNLNKDIEALLEKKVELEKHIEVNTKMSTLIKRDFRGYLLTNVVDFIESRAKIYCKDIFNNDNIKFAIDGNNIVINYDSKEYEILSGGEKQKIDIIIQFALRDMLCKFLNFSSNILVLDEITDALDILGAQKVFDMISRRLSDVEAIYIISHHTTDFDIPEDDEIIIEKGSDKISRII